MKVINIKSTNWTIEVDEQASEQDVRNNEPLFFKTKFGKRESYVMYRGCLIVRYTRLSFDNKSVRNTAAYLFGKSSENNKKITFNIAGCGITSIYQAKKCIDQILSQGWYSYGLKDDDQSN